jgi:SAM-dependent methyltransferase
MMRIALPVYVPSWTYTALRAFKHKTDALRAPSLNLFGDREIEWSFIASRLPAGPGRLLDFGASSGDLSILAAQRGFGVLAVDLGPERFPWRHPGVSFLQADILEADLPPQDFDVILNCSSVEHVGLRGRYGVASEETDGDLAAMRKLLQLLKPSGTMLLTVPCGRDATILPWHRVYGEGRLPRLLAGFRMEEQIYWIKRRDNYWHLCERSTALSFVPTSHAKSPVLCSYALGCFVLQPESRPD